MTSTKRYARRLFTGDFSQGQAFWVILIPVLLMIKFSIAMLSLMNVIPNPVLSTRIWLPIAILTFGLLMPLVFISTYRAIYIAAAKFKGGRHSLMLALATTYLLGAMIFELVDQRSFFHNMAQIALKQDDFNLTITAENKRLVLDGALSYDSTERIRKTFAEHPETTTVELNLSGGHLHEARLLSAFITDQGLDTLVREECSGTCMLVLIGGKQRIAEEGAQLRFHRTIGYDNGYRSDWLIERERWADQRLYRRRGVAESYIYPIYYKQKNDAYLEPGLTVLRSYGVLTDII